MSTVHGVVGTGVERDIGEQSGMIPAPEVAVKYNQYMGGVEVWDAVRLNRNYSLEQHFKPRVACWKKLYFGALDTAHTNAHILWRYGMPERTHYNFLHQLHLDLIISTYITVGTRGGGPKKGQQEDNIPCYVANMPQGGPTKLRGRGRCVVASVVSELLTLSRRGPAARGARFRCARAWSASSLIRPKLHNQEGNRAEISYAVCWVPCRCLLAFSVAAVECL